MAIEELSPGENLSSMDVADNLKKAASTSEIVMYSSSEADESAVQKQFQYASRPSGSCGTLQETATPDCGTAAPGIPEFFSGRSVLVTGATGFMGKVLVEKLLRSCPEIDTIYLLVRAKKGCKVQERVAALVENRVFDRIRDGGNLKKLVAVEGDVSSPGLALSSEDIRTLTTRVSVVFHCAATVRFQEPLRDAVLLNVRGSREVARLALLMPRLQALVHVSTAFSNSDRSLVEELIYPAPADYNAVIEYAEKWDEKTLDSITSKLLKSLPNTYVFSKSLAEHVMYSYKDLLPIAICRPSVVSPSYCEPHPGWVDSSNGPMGVLIGASSGILRSIQGNGDMKTDILPVDMGINALIAAAWDTAINQRRDIPVYNCTTGTEMSLTWNMFLKEGVKQYTNYPSTNMFWYPGGAMHRNYFVHIIYFLLFQMLPAAVIDCILYIRGRKPWLVSLQKKIFYTGNIVKYFLLNEWSFTNKNLKRLYSKLNITDKSSFNFDASTIDFNEYVKLWVIGARRYMLKLDDSSIPQARIAIRRLYWADRFVRITSFGLLLWIVYYFIHITCTIIF